MKVLEERCDVITNMEVMLLLVQHQQLLPSVDSLLRRASKPSSSSSADTTATVKSKVGLRSSSDREEGAGGLCDSAAERFRLENVKDLLYQHMFNQMVQDYIRKTCPYLHLVRSPPDGPPAVDRPRNQQGTRTPVRRPLGGPAGSRRASGVAAMRQGGGSPFISRRCRECLDALVHRFGLTDLELLTIMNLGARKLVEIYVFLEDCSSRFTEDDAAAMLSLIDLALVQQQALPPLPESTNSITMDAEHHDGPNNAAHSELEVLRKQQKELQEEARELELKHMQFQAAGWPSGDRPVLAPHSEGNTRRTALPCENRPDPSTSKELFAPSDEGGQRAADGTGPAPNSQKEGKSRAKAGRNATAKRRAPSRRKRVLDD